MLGSYYHLLFQSTNIEQLSSLNTLFESSHVTVLVVIVVFHNFALYFAEEMENRVVDRGQDDEDGDKFGPVGGNELDRCDEDDEILVDAEDRVAGDEYFLIVLSISRRT